MRVKIPPLKDLSIKEENMSKTILQKGYEKLTMLEHNSEKLMLIGAYDATGKPMLILALREDDNVTPIARILTENDIDSIEPNWEYTEKITDVVKGARAIDDRMFIESFQGQYPKIDEYFDKADY